MLIVLVSTIILCTLITEEISQTLQKSSEIIFDLNSLRQASIIKQSLEIFWVTFFVQLSQPLISLHQLYNFQQLQTNIKVNSQEIINQNCYHKTLIEIQTACYCNLNNSSINSNQDDLINTLQHLIQFNTFLPTHQFGVQQFMGFFDSQTQYLFNYPCLDFINYTIYEPKTRPWYIEAQKAYNGSNFQQYSIRLTEHYLTIPFNDIRFSIALPLINLSKIMIGALRVHIQSKILQDFINNEQMETNLILTTNNGMLLVSNLFNNSEFELGNDYFYNETKTGFNLEDWQALTYTNVSNCNHFDIGFICRQNKIDNQSYYMMHTSLEQYNLQIILYQNKFSYDYYISNHSIQMKAQIQNELIKGTALLIAIAIVITLISSIFLRIIIKPLQQIANIFQVNKYSSAQSITERLLKCKISKNYAGIFKKPSCLISKDIFLFCQCVHKFISNFSTTRKNSNMIYKHLDQIKYPLKSDQIPYLLEYQIQFKDNQEYELNQKYIQNLIRTCMVNSNINEY
ncbi:unnamed protein product [Paramecium primaurelia]|uniref:Transmembrane protein n=1 Tax=Paramecium primaurelia TaxID=5886 RepID=A0A8S1JTW7_PARPR|nr:unnamed protein product [Paramecium primaurelia]